VPLAMREIVNRLACTTKQISEFENEAEVQQQPITLLKVRVVYIV
jgi:hypothetical protein